MSYVYIPIRMRPGNIPTPQLWGSDHPSVLPRDDVGFPPEVVHHLHLARHRRVPRVLAPPVRRGHGVRVRVRVLRQRRLARGDGGTDLPGLRQHRVGLELRADAVAFLVEDVPLDGPREHGLERVPGSGWGGGIGRTRRSEVRSRLFEMARAVPKKNPTPRGDKRGSRIDDAPVQAGDPRVVGQRGHSRRLNVRRPSTTRALQSVARRSVAGPCSTRIFVEKVGCSGPLEQSSFSRVPLRSLRHCSPAQPYRRHHDHNLAPNLVVEQACHTRQGGSARRRCPRCQGGASR